MAFVPLQEVRGAHGNGVILAVRQGSGMDPGVRGSTELLAAISAIGSTDMFYPPDQYPYVVGWEDGYQDFYAEQDLESA